MNKNFNHIFWDFDGVLINSDKIRSDGFRHIFKLYKDRHIIELLNFHKKNGGLSRYIKINYFYEKIIKKPLTEKLLKFHLLDYTNFVSNKLINPKLLIENNILIIREKQNLNHYIVSASDEEELKMITNKLKIDSLFNQINGSPTTKDNNITQIINKFKLNRNDCVLIGDSINDFNAANINNIEFIGYNNIDLKNRIKNYAIKLDNFL